MDQLTVTEVFVFRPRGVGVKSEISVVLDGRIRIRRIIITQNQGGSLSVSWPKNARPFPQFIDEMNAQILDTYLALVSK